MRKPTLVAEILSVGTELLLGQITDTNATYISQAFAQIGIDVHFRVTVGDNLDRITRSSKRIPVLRIPTPTYRNVRYYGTVALTK